jgi:hypothetical protein
MRNASEFTVHFLKDGVTQSFPPGSEFPEWAEKLVTNPLVIGEKTEAASDESKDSSDGPPPHAGKGSGAKVWAAYAESNGVDVEADASRDDIIAACEEAGVEV